jgi:hypothetical protein
VIIYVAAGSGHTSISHPIQAGLETLFPGKYLVREMDFIKEIGPASFDRSSKDLWSFMLKHPAREGFPTLAWPLSPERSSASRLRS